MGFFDRFVGRMFERQLTQMVSRAIGDGGSVGGFGVELLSTALRGASAKKGTQELIDMYNQSPELRAVVAKIIEQIVAAQWCLYRTGGPSPRSMQEAQHEVAMLQRRAAMQRKTAVGQPIDAEPVESGPMFELLRQPNPQFDTGAFNGVIEAWLDLKDEAFVVFERNGRGRIGEMWPAAPHWSRLETNGTLTVQWPAGSRTNIPPEDYAWILNPNPSDPYGRGQGIGDVLAQDLDASAACALFVKSFFQNNARPDILMIMKGVLKQGQLDAAKEYWEQQLRGVGRNSKVHFAVGDVGVHVFDQAFKDRGIVELRKDIADRVRQTYGVSPELFGLLESSNRATISEALRILAITVIRPRLERLMKFWQAVADRVEPGLTVIAKPSLPEDFEFRLSVMQAAPYAFKVNEWRELAGALPADDGDCYVVQATVVSVKSLDELALPDMSNPDDPKLLPAPGDNPPDDEPDEDDEMPELDEDEQKMLSQSFQHAIDALQKAAAADINEVLSALQPQRLERATKRVFEANIEEWGVQELKDLGVNARFDMLKPGVVEHLRQFSSTRIKDINETTREAIREELAEGMAAGESPKKLAKRVRSVFFDATRARSIAIARTESARSSNFSTREAWEQSGVVQGKQWVATPDDRTRDSHSSLDGTIVGLGDSFRSGGASADYPGDFGVAEEDINCRCTMAAVTTQREGGLNVQQRDIVWRAFDRKLLVWERMARAAFIRGFKAQERDVLTKLFEVVA